MQFTKPTQLFARAMDRVVHRNPITYGQWSYHDRPATREYNLEFDTPRDIMVWTTTAANEEEQKLMLWLATYVGVPKYGWWQANSQRLGLGPYDGQRLLMWATMRSGPVPLPVPAVVLGVLPAKRQPDQPLRMLNLAERNPEKLKRMSVAELSANTVNKRMLDYYGNIGLHSIIAVANNLVQMEKDTA